MFGENVLVKSVTFLPLNIKSINICCDLLVTYEFLNLFLNVFNSEAIKVCHIIIHI